MDKDEYNLFGVYHFWENCSKGALKIKKIKIVAKQCCHLTASMESPFQKVQVAVTGCRRPCFTCLKTYLRYGLNNKYHLS